MDSVISFRSHQNICRFLLIACWPVKSQRVARPARTILAVQAARDGIHKAPLVTAGYEAISASVVNIKRGIVNPLLFTGGMGAHWKAILVACAIAAI